MVTMLSPRILAAYGVPVYTTVQNPGEFVITFPQSYHSGFNHGYNVAEAVNFGPVDWLGYGVRGMERYRQFWRTPVFSHDMLLVRLGMDGGVVPPGLWMASTSSGSGSTGSDTKDGVASSGSGSGSGSGTDSNTTTSTPIESAALRLARDRATTALVPVDDSHVSTDTHALLWMKDGLVRLVSEERVLRGYLFYALGIKRARMWVEDTETADLSQQQQRRKSQRDTAVTADGSSGGADAEDATESTPAAKPKSAKSSSSNANAADQPLKRESSRPVRKAAAAVATKQKQEQKKLALANKKRKLASSKQYRATMSGGGRDHASVVAAPPPSSAFGTAPGELDTSVISGSASEEFKYAKERYKPRTRSKL